MGAGGSHDRNARVFTSVIPDFLGQAVIVKLMPGASGQVGTAAAARAKPDGYTLLFTYNYYDQLQQHVKKMPYNTNKDFVSVAQLNSGNFSVIVRADSQFKTWQQLVAYVKKNSGKLKLSHSGQWGAGHVPSMQLRNEADIGGMMIMVPYKGGGPSMRGFLAGEANLTVQFKSTIKAQGKKVRVLISAGKKSQFPPAPTFKDLGYTADLGQKRRIIMAPRGIPADRLAKLQDALEKIQKFKTYRKLIKAIGEETNFINGPDYEKLRPKQSADFKMLVKSLTGK